MNRLRVNVIVRSSVQWVGFLGASGCLSGWERSKASIFVHSPKMRMTVGTSSVPTLKNFAPNTWEAKHISAHDERRQSANAGPAAEVLRQQGRPRMRFLQILEDRYRFEQRRPSVDHERGHYALRVDRLVFLGMLLSLQQINRDLLDLDPFERESGAHPVGGERPPEPVEFHSHRLASLQRFGGTTGTRT